MNDPDNSLKIDMQSPCYAWGNKFIDANYANVWLDQSAFIGTWGAAPAPPFFPQGIASDNRWDNSNTQGFYGPNPWTDLTSGATFGNFSTIIHRNNFSTQFTPNNSSAFFSTILSKLQISPTSPPINCNANPNPTPLAPANIGSGNKVGLNIALDSITFINNDVQSRYHNKRGLFNTLMKKGTFGEVILSTFKSNNSNSSLGNFYIADSLYLESVFSSDTNKINMAESISQGSAANCLPEQNQKKFNSIYTFYLKNNSLDSANLSNLYQLAYLCPVQDGEAIFQARTLLAQFDTISIYNFCELFAISDNNERSQNNIDLVNDGIISIRVYPNPTTNKIFFEGAILLNKENIEICIYNNQGIIVKNVTFHDRTKFEIDLEELSSGLYFFTINDNHGFITKGKFVISN